MPRTLDEWYSFVNGVYLDRNFYRSLESVFCHFIEVSRGLSVAATRGRKKGLVPEEFLPKALAWWFAVCGRAGVPSVERMIWAKFPAACPYCRLSRHDGSRCKEREPKREKIDWAGLKALGLANESGVPSTLADWQKMFQTIYVRDEQTDHELNVKRLAEEIGELSEAIRTISLAPRYFVSEAPDVFAWLMGFANQFDSDRGARLADYGKTLESQMESEYPDGCKVCGWPVCKCPPILTSTLGRIAKEAPIQTIFPDYPKLLDLDSAMLLFSRAEAVFKIGDQKVKASTEELHLIAADVRRIVAGVDSIKEMQPSVLAMLSAQLGYLEGVTNQGVLTQSSIDALMAQLMAIPSPQSGQVLGFMNNLAASSTFLALTKAVAVSLGINLQ